MFALISRRGVWGSAALKLARLTFLFGAVVLAGCQAVPPPPVAQAPVPIMGPTRGLDMATDSSDVLGELKGFPLNFVARYYRDPTSRWPALSPSEAQRLSALGLKIVTVWEWHSTDPAYFTYASGYSDAMSAAQQAKAVGQPAGSAIYFSVDFNARGSQLGQIDQYFRGIDAGLAAAGGGRPEYKVGVYGSGAVCAMIKGEGLAQYAWLTGSTAWDGTLGFGAWNIRQAPHGGRFPNLAFDHDANEAINDYGGFQLANAYAASAASAAVTAAAAGPAAAATLVNGMVTAMIPAGASATPPLPPTAPGAPATRVALAAPQAAAAPPAPVAAAAPVPTAAAVGPVAPPAIAPPPVASPATAATRVESAALEAAALAAATVLPRAAAAGEMPHRSPPPAERAAIPDEPSHDRAAARTGKALVSPKQRVAATTPDSRAPARSPRQPASSSHAESHEPEHRTSLPRPAEDHGAHLPAGKPATVHALNPATSRDREQPRPERPHRVRRVLG
jgi:hypothetical protein